MSRLDALRPRAVHMLVAQVQQGAGPSLRGRRSRKMQCRAALQPRVEPPISYLDAGFTRHTADLHIIDAFQPVLQRRQDAAGVTSNHVDGSHDVFCSNAFRSHGAMQRSALELKPAAVDCRRSADEAWVMMVDETRQASSAIAKRLTIQKWNSRGTWPARPAAIQNPAPASA